MEYLQEYRKKYLQPAPSPRVRRKDTNIVHDTMWKITQQPTQQTRYNLRSTRGTNFRHLAAQQLLAQHLYNSHGAMHILNAQGQNMSMDSLLKGPQGESFGKKC